MTSHCCKESFELAKKLPCRMLQLFLHESSGHRHLYYVIGGSQSKIIGRGGWLHATQFRGYCSPQHCIQNGVPASLYDWILGGGLPSYTYIFTDTGAIYQPYNYSSQCSSIFILQKYLRLSWITLRVCICIAASQAGLFASSDLCWNHDMRSSTLPAITDARSISARLEYLPHFTFPAPAVGPITSGMT